MKSLKAGLRYDALGVRGALAALLLLTAFCLLPTALLAQVATVYVPNSTQIIPSGATAAVDFSAVLIGSSSGMQSVVLTNTGASSLTVSLSFTGTNLADFSQTNYLTYGSNVTNCSTPLAALASCSIQITFTPSTTGLETAALSIATNAVVSPYTVGVTGTGVMPGGGSDIQCLNDSSTGTTLYKFAKYTSVGACIIATTSDNKSGQVIGVVTAGAGTSDFATVKHTGIVPLQFDGNTTAGDFVLVSTTAGGDGYDSGSTLPGDGSQVMGRARITQSSGAGLYSVDLGPINISGGSGTAATSAAFTSAPTPSAAAGVTLGTALLPFGTMYFGTAATNTYSFNPVTGLGAARPMWFGDYGSNGAMAIADPTTKTKMLLLDLHSATGTLSLVDLMGASRTLSIQDPGNAANLVTSPAPVQAVGASLAVTAAMCGSQILVGATTGEAVTLPAASSSLIGCTYDFIITVTDTSGYNEIQTTGSNYLLGEVQECASGIACLDFWADGSSIKALKMGQTTTGGFLGSHFHVVGISSTQWEISGTELGSGTMVTAFTNTP